MMQQEIDRGAVGFENLGQFRKPFYLEGVGADLISVVGSLSSVISTNNRGVSPLLGAISDQKKAGSFLIPLGKLTEGNVKF